MLGERPERTLPRRMKKTPRSAGPSKIHVYLWLSSGGCVSLPTSSHYCRCLADLINDILRPIVKLSDSPVSKIHKSGTCGEELCLRPYFLFNTASNEV